MPLSSRSRSRSCKDSPATLEYGWTLAALGTALRHERKGVEAREPLGEALEIARRAGAIGLERHVRDEIAATGAAPRVTDFQGMAALTPSEKRVAGLAVEGMTNREIAQILFVTPKTIEVHLSQRLPQARRQVPPRAARASFVARRTRALLGAWNPPKSLGGQFGGSPYDRRRCAGYCLHERVDLTIQLELRADETRSPAARRPATPGRSSSAAGSDWSPRSTPCRAAARHRPRKNLIALSIEAGVPPCISNRRSPTSPTSATASGVRSSPRTTATGTRPAQVFNLDRSTSSPPRSSTPSPPRTSQAAVRFARKHDLRVAPQTTGHNAGPLIPDAREHDPAQDHPHEGRRDRHRRPHRTRPGRHGLGRGHVHASRAPGWRRSTDPPPPWASSATR